eukprot:TRINITY_DN306_c0_g4_i1.p1 TRINITY_DN306_c0_g4~~TRINITY_DN306_c0_g4_i1.p1  ORF type:complete len:499 (+),score=219.92 TRINITY_DN306_c0_g4_i1:163-1659(+)
MPPKKAVSSYYETPDPMIASADALYHNEALYARWNPNLTQTTGWDWAEMKKRLSEKPADEKWYIVKSVDTLPAEDGNVPFVPNFIVFKLTAEPSEGIEAQAPRLSLKAAVRDSTMDAEGFIADEVVDMKGNHHWRPLKDVDNVFVLAGVSEDTTPPKMFDFGATGGGSNGFNFGASTPAAENTGFNFGAPAPAGTGFNFGASTPASGSTGFNFGAPAPAGTGFNFSAPAATAETQSGTKRKADDEVGGEPVVKKPKSTAPPDVQPDVADVVFPVLWQEDTVDGLREDISGGMKIITTYESEEKKEDGTPVFQQRLVVENDFEFLTHLKKSETKAKEVIQTCVQKKLLVKSAEFKKLKDEIYELAYTGADDHEKNQKLFEARRAEILKGDVIKGATKDIMEEHYRPMLKHLKEIARERLDKKDHVWAVLSAIKKDLRDGKMYGREGYTIMRVFPEKDSHGAYCAFRPARTINKSVGKADDCYPPPYRMLNMLTGEYTTA